MKSGIPRVVCVLGNFRTLEVPAAKFQKFADSLSNIQVQLVSAGHTFVHSVPATTTTASITSDQTPGFFDRYSGPVPAPSQPHACMHNHIAGLLPASLLVMPEHDVSQLAQVAPEPLELDELTTKDVSAPSVSNGVDEWLKRLVRILVPVQKISSVGFASFLGIHLTSVVVVPGLGIPLPESQQIFEMARALYQWAPFENIILGCAGVHIAAGIGLRLARTILGTRKLKRRGYRPIHRPDDEDIGLGGITSLLGLGYRRSWISTVIPSMSPLAFSGYASIPLVLFHYFKFRLRPVSIDGDSALVNLHYVPFVLKGSAWGTLGNWINVLSLGALVWVVLYHWVSGVMRYQGWFSPASKKWGYFVISTISVLGAISMGRLSRLPLDMDFAGKRFMLYAR